MHEVVSNVQIAPDIHRIVLEAPRIAAARNPGQFVIVRSCEGGERIPLTIADADTDKGTITLIIQAIGTATKSICALQQGQSLRDVAGPLGHPTEISDFGRVVCVGGGVGTAVLFPLAKALADAGNHVTTIIGGRTDGHILLKDDLSEFCQEVLIATEDGSAGTKGFVTHVLEDILKDPQRVPAAIYAVGPVPMMKAVVDQASTDDIKVIVSLNPIMVDGTGMCGGCRVTIGDEIKFACVDGPEFEGKDVDFDELSRRQNAYKDHACRFHRHSDHK